MNKKPFRIVICLLISAFLAFGVTGCALFEHNYDKDYQQVVASVASVTETRTVGGSVKEFKSRPKTIYKSQLVNSLNQNAASLIEQQGMTLEDATEYLLDQLVYRQLILNEADKLIYFGDLEWTTKDDNAVAQAVYASIDAQLKSIQKEILEEHDEPAQGDAENTDTETTYPVPDSEEPEEDENPEKWVPDVNDYPALFGDSEKKSLEREAVRRLVDVFEEAVKDDFIATAEEKKFFESDVKRMRNLIAAQREDLIYPMLYDPQYIPGSESGSGTYIVEYLLGKSARENRMMTKLEEYVEKDVFVSEQEILDQYESMLTAQKEKYKDAAAYKKDITGDTETVIYSPDSNYFFVKHILVPFSDAQKSELEAYKNSNLYTASQIKNYRDKLAEQIIGYPHVDGEDDLTRPMSITSIFNTVKSAMSPYRYSPRDAERKFDSLTYEFNTDPGAFGNVKGYALPYELAEGEEDTYMKEFAEAARDMYDTLEVGQLYDKPVVTDYGVHIMYLASRTVAGKEKGLNDYQTPAEYKTIEEIVKETLTNNKQAAAFNTWQQEKITYYEDTKKIVERYEKRYKDLYEA